MTQTAITREPVAGRRLEGRAPERRPRPAREAQALRYRVPAPSSTPFPEGAEDGLDRDDYDRHCAIHRRVRDLDSGGPGGHHPAARPSRRRTPRAAGRSSEEFHLSGPTPCTARDVLEIGRTCVGVRRRQRRHHRGTGANSPRSSTRRYRYLMGCASIPMRDGGMQAKAVMQRLRERYLHRLPAGRAEELCRRWTSRKTSPPSRRRCSRPTRPGRQDLRRYLLGPWTKSPTSTLLKRDEPCSSHARHFKAAVLMARLRLLLRSSPARAGRAWDWAWPLAWACAKAARRRRHAAAPAPGPCWWLARLLRGPALRGQGRAAKAPATHAVVAPTMRVLTDILLLGALAPG